MTLEELEKENAELRRKISDLAKIAVAGVYSSRLFVLSGKARIRVEDNGKEYDLHPDMIFNLNVRIQQQ